MMANQVLVNEICPTTTQVWVKRGALLVDVREKDEVKQLAFDVPNIVNIPLSEFENRFSELPKDKELVIVCRAGVRSLRAAGFLINHGYETVVNMKHGIIRWVNKGFPAKGNLVSVLDINADSSCCSPQSSKTANSSCCDSSKNDDSPCC